jgi:hypothetical protein
MEIIGLSFGTTILFAIAIIFGCILASLTWLFLRKRSGQLRLPMLGALVLPPFCVAYFLACIAFLPGKSLFGDISEPLPNGYYLQALGKMPDFAGIAVGSSFDESEIHLSECIGSLTVSGPFVAGRYSHPCDRFDPHANEAYFLFDTRNGKVTEFVSLHDLKASLRYFRTTRSDRPIPQQRTVLRTAAVAQ